MITPRQAFLTLEYDGKDISSDIRKDVENFTFMLTIYDYFLNRSFCILCHAKGRIRYKKFFRM